VTTDKTSTAVREPYDAMGPVDAPNPPAARATLATVKHGGCVQLPTSERERFEAWHRGKFKTRWQTGAPTRDMHNGVYADNYGPAEQQERWELWQAATAARYAQPSPGGQGDELDLDRVLSLADVHAEESREDGVRLLDRGGLLAFAQDVVSALAARQPVASNQPSGNSGELAVDSQPVGCTDCPVTGLPFYGNMEHPKLGWIAMYGGPLDVYSVPELQDNDGELRRERYDLDADCWVEGGEPLGYFYSEQQPDATQPAQAVDLGMQQDAARWRAIAPHLSVEWDEDEMLKRWTWIDFKGDALSVPTRTRESYASVEEAIDAVIDSQAVGNG